MIERAGRASLPQQPHTVARIAVVVIAQDLQRDNALQSWVARAIDVAHTAGPKLANDFVWTEP
jgi:hypothetical protein